MSKENKIKNKAKQKQTGKGKGNMPIPKSEVLNNIKLLLKNEPDISASKIAKRLKIRKQTALNLVREAKNIPKNPKKITYHKPTPVTLDNMDVILRLYREGYPIKLIKQIMSKRYKISFKRTARVIKDQATDDDKITRKKYQKCNRKQPHEWLKNHYDGALYRYTKMHYSKNYTWDNEEYEKLFDNADNDNTLNDCLNED